MDTVLRSPMPYFEPYFGSYEVRLGSPVSTLPGMGEYTFQLCGDVGPECDPGPVPVTIYRGHIVGRLDTRVGTAKAVVMGTDGVQYILHGPTYGYRREAGDVLCHELTEWGND